MKLKTWYKENITCLVKISVLVIAFLKPILLLVLIWANYSNSHNQLSELIGVLKNTTQQNINLEPLKQYFESNAQFNFNIIISIIDIAIAVWLGLNIYNILSKKDLSSMLDEYKENLDLLKNQIKKIDMKAFKLDKAFLIAGEKDLYRKVQYCQEIIEKEQKAELLA